MSYEVPITIIAHVDITMRAQGPVDVDNTLLPVFAIIAKEYPGVKCEIIETEIDGQVLRPRKRKGRPTPAQKKSRDET